MKKNLFFIVFFISINVFSQNKSVKYTSSYLFESFEGTKFPPSGWVKKMPLGGTGWERLTTNCLFPGWFYFALPAPQWGGKSYAVADFATGNSTWALPGEPSDQWLITPPITISTGDSLKFQIIPCLVSSNDMDSIDVLLSTTNDSITSFTTILMSLWSANFTSSTSWTHLSASLSSFSGHTVYIAFHEHILNNTNNGVGFSLDMVSIGTPPLNDVGVESTDIAPIIQPGYFTPQATIINIGSATQTFSVTMTINPGSYTSTKTITSLPCGQTYQLSFDSLLAVNNTSYNVITRTSLTGDADSTNNADTINVLCYVQDPILWDNRSNYPTTTGLSLYNIVSTKYRLPSFHNMINVADDFTIPANSTWTITSIKTAGYSVYTGAGIDKFGINIYNEKNFKPFTIVASDSVSLVNESNNADTAQTLILNHPFTLTSGKYWLSVFAIFDTVTLPGNGAWQWFVGANQIGDSCQIENNTGLYGSNFTWESYAVYASHILFPNPAPVGKSAFFTIHGTSINNIDNNAISKILIYPNPAKNIINIENAENANIFIYNLLGDIIMANKCNSTLTTFDLSNLPSGSYILKVVSNDVVTKKIDIIR